MKEDDILSMLYTAEGAVSISCYHLVAWLEELRVGVSDKVTSEGTSNSKLTANAFVGWDSEIYRRPERLWILEMNMTLVHVEVR